MKRFTGVFLMIRRPYLLKGNSVLLNQKMFKRGYAFGYLTTGWIIEV